MAALTWRDVTAPDYRGVQSSINSAADLLAKSTNGMSGALTQFGDQQALQKLAQYSDAQKLRADLQSGQFSTANASPEALAAIMNRPANLLSNAASQQSFDYNAQKNPLELARQEISNATSEEALNQSKLTNPLVVSTLDRADKLGEASQSNRLAEIAQTTALNNVQYPAAVKNAQYTADLANLNQPQQLLNTARTNTETNRLYPIQEGTRQAQEQIATLQNQGQIPSAVEGNAYFQQLVDSGAHPVVLNAVKGMLEQSFGKGTIGAVSTSVGGSVPSPVANILSNAASGSIPAGAAFNPTVLGNAIYGQESSSGKADTTKVNSQNVTGPMQIQKATFEGLKKNGVIPADYDWQNPEHNKAAGFAHIADLSKSYKTPEQVAAVYYSGPDAVNADGSINRGRKNPERPNDPTVGQYVDQVMARSGTTSQTQAATPTGVQTDISTKSTTDESTDIFALRRKFQTLIQQSAGISSQDNTEFSARVLKSLTTPMNISEAATAIRKDPAFTNVHESTIVDALNKAQEKSGLTNFAPLAEVVKMSLSGNTELNTTKGAPWFTGTFDYKKLEKFAQQAGDLPKSLLSAEGVAKRQDELAQLSSLMPQIEALNTERINLFQQKQLGKPGAAAALAQVDKKIKDMDLINPSISGLDKELTSRIKNSPKTEAELKSAANAAAKALKAAASKSTTVSSTNSASLIAAADKAKAPVRSSDGGKTWSLEVDTTIRNPAVKYHQLIENPIYTKLKGKTFKSREEAEKAYQEARKK